MVRFKDFDQLNLNEVREMARRKTRPTIPESIKRLVRQEAGFGCCKCGNPIIEYHHIAPESKDPRDIMVLCPICHHEATVGAMTKEEQQYYKLHPFNIRRGYVKGKLKINQEIPVIVIGTNQFVGEGDFILVNQESLLSLKVNSGRLELSVKLYDQNDNLLAHIKDNEWISGNPMPWDLESSFQWLKIRHKLRNIALEVDARRFPIEIRANLWRKGQNFELNPYQIRFNGIVQNVGFINLCFVAIRLVADISSKRFKLEPDPRFGKGVLVSWPDIQERIKKGLKAWEQLKKM